VRQAATRSRVREIHERRLATDSTHGKTAPDDLARHERVWFEAELGVRALHRVPQRLHLVEDEEATAA
jgi:hypothetical protein